MHSVSTYILEFLHKTYKMGLQPLIDTGSLDDIRRSCLCFISYFLSFLGRIYLTFEEFLFSSSVSLCTLSSTRFYLVICFTHSLRANQTIFYDQFLKEKDTMQKLHRFLRSIFLSAILSKIRVPNYSIQPVQTLSLRSGIPGCLP